MESPKCGRPSRDAVDGIATAEGDGILGGSCKPTRKSRGEVRDGQQGQEHEEEHGEEAGSEDAEGEATGEEGEVAARVGERPTADRAFTKSTG